MSEPKYLTMPKLYPGSTRPPTAQNGTAARTIPFTSSELLTIARIRSARRLRDNSLLRKGWGSFGRKMGGSLTTILAELKTRILRK